MQVKCQPHHSLIKNEIKPSYSFHRLQPKAPEQLSRKKDGRGEEDFSSSKVHGIFHCYPFCHLIRRTKGFPLFQPSICIYNNVLPWQNLIIPDFLGGITSLQEYREGKTPPRLGALGISRGMAQVPPWPGHPRSSGVGLEHPQRDTGVSHRAKAQELQELPLSPARAGKCETEGGTLWARSGAACSQIL